MKIPATAEGIPAVRQMISEGRSINITLIFSLERYAEVIEAYLAGLEAYDGDLAPVHSVASFFVSRVDTEVDRRLNAIGTPEALALRGRAAVAQAKLAYQLFRERFSGERWQRLTTRGARVQRPLWASTSTKNPEYPDTLYVSDLIAPDTVNTMPMPQNTTHTISMRMLMRFQSSCSTGFAPVRSLARRYARKRMSDTSMSAAPMIIPSAMRNVIFRNGSPALSQPMDTK